MSVHVTAEHLGLAEELVAEAWVHGGLAPVDLDRFGRIRNGRWPILGRRIVRQRPWGC